VQGYSGLRAQDLQEAKDQLLVETSDMLHVPLFTAEALLRNHGTVTDVMSDMLSVVITEVRLHICADFLYHSDVI